MSFYFIVWSSPPPPSLPTSGLTSVRVKFHFPVFASKLMIIVKQPCRGASFISPGAADAEMQLSLLLGVHKGTRTPTSLDMDSDAGCKDLAKYQPANIRCPWLSLSPEGFSAPGVTAPFPIPPNSTSPSTWRYVCWERSSHSLLVFHQRLNLASMHLFPEISVLLSAPPQV